MKTVYLEMPVSFEVKRDWNKKGFKVVDKRFMPDGYDNPAGDKKDKPLTAKQLQEEIAASEDLARLAELSEDSRKTVSDAALARIEQLKPKD